MPTHILQIETSTEVCSVAVSCDGLTLAHIDVPIANSHSELITITIQQCLDRLGFHLSTMDAIAIGAGPGSYTSLRVGYSTVKGLSYSIDKPLITIPSLQILAASVANPQNDTCIAAMIDARRMDAYVSIYSHTLDVVQHVDALTLDESTFDTFKTSFTYIHLCGTGASKYIEHFGDEKLILGATNTSAAFMSQLAFNAFKQGQFTDVAYATPDYLKSPNITESKKNFF